MPIKKHGPHVYSADSFDELIEHMQQNAPSAHDIKPWQRALSPGDYAIRVRDLADNQYTPRLVVLFYKVEPCNYVEDEWLLPENIFVTGYSIMCPEGELGTVHRSLVHAKISVKEFHRAREQEWNVEPHHYRVDILSMMKSSP
jgi:hypothetical protein